MSWISPYTSSLWLPEASLVTMSRSRTAGLRISGDAPDPIDNREQRPCLEIFRVPAGERMAGKPEGRSLGNRPSAMGRNSSTVRNCFSQRSSNVRTVRVGRELRGCGDEHGGRAGTRPTRTPRARQFVRSRMIVSSCHARRAWQIRFQLYPLESTHRARAPGPDRQARSVA